jgi:hypothetical protein
MDCLRGGRLRRLWSRHPSAQNCRGTYGDFDVVSTGSGLAVVKPIERVWKDGGVSFRASMEPLFDSGAAGAKLDQSH